MGCPRPGAFAQGSRYDLINRRAGHRSVAPHRRDLTWQIARGRNRGVRAASPARPPTPSTRAASSSVRGDRHTRMRPHEGRPGARHRRRRDRVDRRGSQGADRIRRRREHREGVGAAGPCAGQHRRAGILPEGDPWTSRAPIPGACVTRSRKQRCRRRRQGAAVARRGGRQRRRGDAPRAVGGDLFNCRS